MGWYVDLVFIFKYHPMDRFSTFRGLNLVHKVLDVESLPWPVGPNGTTNITTMEVRSGLTDLVCALKHALRVAIPGSILSFTTAGNAMGYSDAMDYAALSECLDFFMPMTCENRTVCTAVPVPTFALSPRFLGSIHNRLELHAYARDHRQCCGAGVRIHSGRGFAVDGCWA
jgi:hypothetical protein